jgi:hypothetical protein
LKSREKVKPSKLTLDIKKLCDITSHLFDKRDKSVNDVDDVQTEERHKVFIERLNEIKYRQEVPKTYKFLTTSTLSFNLKMKSTKPNMEGKYLEEKNQGKEEKIIREKNNDLKAGEFSDFLHKTLLPYVNISKSILGPIRNSSMSQLENSPDDVILSILKKSYYDRSKDDIEKMNVLLRGIPAFKTFPEFVLLQLYGVVRLEEFEANKIVFRQGEVGTCWYVVFEGSVDLYVGGVKIKELKFGEGFGEKALLNDSNRTAVHKPFLGAVYVLIAPFHLDCYDEFKM